MQAIIAKKQKDEYIRYWKPFESEPGKGDYQVPIFDCFQPGVKEIYIIGGNRSGKTIDGAAISMAYLMGKEYFKGTPAWEWVSKLPIPEGRPRQIWVVGLDFTVVSDTILGEYFLRGKNIPPMLPRNWESLGFRVTEGKNPQIKNPDGSILTLKSAESGADKFQSASVDLVWIDEEPDVTIYDECWQRTVDCNGIIVVTVTPLVDSASGARVPWIFAQVTKAREGDPSIRVVQLNTLLNPTISDEAKEALKKKWAGHPEEAARLYGEFIQRSGLVYPTIKTMDTNNPIAGGVIIPAKVHPRSIFRACMIDPAPTGPSACVWAVVYPDPSGNYSAPGDYVFIREYKESNLVVSDHAKNILAMNGGEPVDVWYIDPWGGNQKNAESHKTTAQLYRENGIPVRFPNLPEDYGLEVAREYFTAANDPTSRHAKAYIEGENCPMLLQELKGYVWDFYDRGSRKGQSKGHPRKLNDHEINCVQYLLGMRLKGRRQERQRPTIEQQRERALRNSYT